jgi:hypothetical protein
MGIPGIKNIDTLEFANTEHYQSDYIKQSLKLRYTNRVYHLFFYLPVLLFFLKKGKMEDTKSVAYHSGD